MGTSTTAFYSFSRDTQARKSNMNVLSLIGQFFCFMFLLEMVSCAQLDTSSKIQTLDNRISNKNNELTNIETTSNVQTKGHYQDSNVVGVASVWLPWVGATCSIQNCSNPYNKTTLFPAPYYACSTGVGQWNQGAQLFLDPIPQGYEISYANITFSGSFFCDTQLSQTTFILELNEMLLAYGEFPVGVPGCNCGCFMNTSMLSNSDISNQFTGYFYGGYNQIIVIPINNDICLMGIQIDFYYMPIPISLTAISPSKAPSNQDTLVTLKGSGFFNLSTLSCKFGQVIVPATYVDNTTITCVAPAVSTPGTVPVSASNTGQYFSAALYFNYQSVSPNYSEDFKQFMETYWWLIVSIAIPVIVIVVIVTIILVKRSKAKQRRLKRMLAINGEEPTNPLLGSSRGSIFNSLEIKDDIDYKEIEIAERIGRGNFGEVYKGVWRGTVVAVKKTKIPSHVSETEELQFLEDFAREAQIMRALRHPNVVQFLGICRSGADDICIITEFMPRGNLNKLLHDRSLHLDWDLRLRIAMDVAKGMNYLHKSNPPIVHRDLKTYNLLVDGNYKVKVCDFGLARLLNQTSGVMTSCGTPAWTAPEVLRNELYTEKADVYSFGIVLWELVTREEPHQGVPPFQVVFAVGTQGVRPPIPSTCPTEFAKLIKDCWAESPTARPSFDEIILRLQSMRKGKDNL
mmetsp:Transcript_27257/g.38413  ORF Transcript_27257/g.38413 Transcript_27257/m.38413 type:complete len:685 (+) Transcript_27257:201-2255(+)